MKEVMNKFKTSSTSSSSLEPSILELKTELNFVKNEVKTIKQRLDKMEMEKWTNELLSQISPPQKDREPGPSKTIEDHEAYLSDATGINTISIVKARSWHIPINLVINKNYVLNKIALLDSGADQNYIYEGLIPTKYLEKGTSRLYSATGECLKINYKLSKAHICNNGICFVNDLVITRGINAKIILGTPFISQIKPYFADLDSLKTNIFGKEIIFLFIKPMSKEENEFLKTKTIFQFKSAF
ncbi:unnamed protein product [Withania somnifera]